MTGPNHPNAEPENVLDRSLNQLFADSEITRWLELQPERIASIGTLRHICMQTKAGFWYQGVIGQPLEPESSVPILATTAWFTSMEGHNKRVVRNLVRAGNPVFFLGSEGSAHFMNGIELPARWPSLSLSAMSMLRFAQRAAESYDSRADLQANASILIGESRGAMVGMGVEAFAPTFGHQVLMADLTAPCFPRPRRPADVLKLGRQGMVETIVLAKLFGSLTLKRLVHYPATVDLHPTAMLHHLATGPALLSGEAGHLAQQVPAESLMHITTFDDDGFSMSDEWDELFVDYPNVKLVRLPGGHLTIASKTLRYVIARNKAAQAVLQAGKKLDSSVFEAAHELAPRQQPAS